MLRNVTKKCISFIFDLPQDILDIKRNFGRLNGSLSTSISLLVFDALIVLVLSM